MKAIIIYYNGQEPTDSDVLVLRNYVSQHLHYIGKSADETVSNISTLSDMEVAKSVIAGTENTSAEKNAQTICVTEVNKIIDKIVNGMSNATPLSIAASLMDRASKDVLLRRRLRKILDENLEINNKEILPIVRMVLKYE